MINVTAGLHCLIEKECGNSTIRWHSVCNPNEGRPRDPTSISDDCRPGFHRGEAPKAACSFRLQS